MNKAARLFDGWEKAMILSCLQGCMGKLIADDAVNPKSAMIDVGGTIGCREKDARLSRQMKSQK